jgi:hypothetical protein
MPLSPNTRLFLEVEDPRTDEEKERDRQREAEEKTHPMFEEMPGEDGNASSNDPAKIPRVFEGYPDRRVTVDGEPLPMTETAERHSPTGFCWGYGGSGPAALAHAILACVADETTADNWYQFFKRDVVADWEMGHPWQITDLEVLAWLAEMSADSETSLSGEPGDAAVNGDKVLYGEHGAWQGSEP